TFPLTKEAGHDRDLLVMELYARTPLRAELAPTRPNGCQQLRQLTSPTTTNCGSHDEGLGPPGPPKQSDNESVRTEDFCEQVQPVLMAAEGSTPGSKGRPGCRRRRFESIRNEDFAMGVFGWTLVPPAGGTKSSPLYRGHRRRIRRFPAPARRIGRQRLASPAEAVSELPSPVAAGLLWKIVGDSFLVREYSGEKHQQLRVLSLLSAYTRLLQQPQAAYRPWHPGELPDSQR
uniref:PIPK domain-containing protein n=1 Tax=Macrostomum lignano TaxID=282301 RepID=A0A1I8FL54_9PLAT